MQEKVDKRSRPLLHNLYLLFSFRLGEIYTLSLTSMTLFM